MLRVTRRPSSGMTPRGSGDHQAMRGPPPAGIGNSPLRYAANRVPGSRSAPTPTTPASSAARAGGNAHGVAGGSMGTPAFYTTSGPVRPAPTHNRHRAPN